LKYLVIVIFSGVVLWANAQNTKKQLSDFQLRLESVSLLIDSTAYVKALVHLYQIRNEYDFKKLEPAEKESFFVKIGTCLYNLGDVNEACKKIHLSIKNAKKAKDDYDFGVALKYGQIGTYFLRTEQKDSCFANFYLGVRHIKKTDNKLYISSAYNNLGLAHEHFNQIDSAIILYEKAIEKLDSLQSKQGRFKSLIYSNIARLYQNDNQIELAKKFLSKAINNLEHNGLYFSSYKPFFYTSLIELKVQSNETKNLKRMVDTALVSTRRLKKDDDRYKNFLKLFKSIKDQNVFDNEKTLKLYAVYSDSLLNSLESIISENKEGLVAYKVQSLEQINTINKLELESKQTELNHTKKQIGYTIGVAILILLLIVSFLFVIIQRAKRRKELFDKENELNKLELENQKLKKKALEDELKLKSDDITNLAIYNSKKAEWNKQIIEKISALKKMDSLDLDKFIKSLEIEFNQQSQVEDKLTKLQQNIEVVNARFQSTLKTRHPELAAGELELCGLIRIKMGGKEIANLRGISPESVTKAKQRLRKKLNLEPNANLFEYLKSI